MNQELLDRVLQSPRLPSLPTIAIDVIELVTHRDVNLRQIANTIKHDPALSSKILKTVNSSFYGQAHSISTVTQALVVLGLNSVKTLALGFSLVGNLRDAGGDGFDHVAFWKRSLYSAVASRCLAKQANVVQQEEAFLGGLLQDLGMIALAQTLGNDYQKLIIEAGGEHLPLLELERKKLDLDHAVIGGTLAENWKLPPVLSAPIRFHESPEEGPEGLDQLVKCVAAGASAADVYLSENPGEALDRYYRHLSEWLGLEREVAEPLLSAIHKDTVEMRRLFDLPTGDLGNPDEILARANEALLQISLQQQHQTTQLEEQNRQLVEQATTDSLTGVANRGRFNEFMAEQFAICQRDPSQPLSVLFLDADHFKSFNDTYGHHIGDRVLVELANVLKRCTLEGGLVARYGGEEFAMVLPNTPRSSAARLAEQTRRLIELTTVKSDEDEPLAVTASIGVATAENGVFAKPEHLVRAADQAVYAAKDSGRNCVRVFAPRRRNADKTAA